VGQGKVVVGHSNGQLNVWNTITGVKETSFNGVGNVTCLDADESSIVAGLTDNSIKVFDIKNNKLEHSLVDHSGPINAVQFDNLKITSASQDGCVNVWDKKTGNRLYALLGGSMQARGRNPPHPTRPGISGVTFDQSRVVVSFNALLRTYTFDAEAM